MVSANRAGSTSRQGNLMQRMKLPTKPKNTGRFQKGQSGNARGRPRSKPTSIQNVSAIKVVTNRVLRITRNGVDHEITAEQALQHRLYQDAINGKPHAQREVVKWIMKRESWVAKEAAKMPPRIPKILFTTDPDNVDAALVLLGIAAENPARAHLSQDRLQLLLEPWAVQMALDRRRRGKTARHIDVAEVQRSTRDPQTLIWPKGPRK